METKDVMTWAAFKAMVDSQGATDESLVGYADRFFGGVDELLHKNDVFVVEEFGDGSTVVLLDPLADRQELKRLA